MKPKLSKIPRKLHLKPGAHIIMPGSTKGGPGKTTIIITMAGVCKLAGLNYIVASFDQSNTALERSLGKDVVVTLDAQTPELARMSLSEVAKHAREYNAIILMDMPGALTNKESVLLDNIRSARVLERCDSLSMIIPISPDPEEIEGGCSAITLFKPDRILLRARKPTKYAPSFESFEKPWSFLSQYPSWDCEQWTQSMKEVITRSGEYTMLPTVPDLAAYLAKNYGTIPEVHELDIEDVVNHLEIAATAIYKHILQPITEDEPKGIQQTPKTAE